MQKRQNSKVVSEAVWSAKYINTLPDSAFLYIAPGGKKDSEGKTAPRALRYFPIKDASGKIDLPHLRNALARIPQSKLPANVKARVAAKAKRMARQNKINVGEEFLDAKNMRFPLSWPAIIESVIAFNQGAHDEFYTMEEIDDYGKKLAERFSQTLSLRTDSAKYDEDGNQIANASDTRSQTVTRYEYHDGQIVTARNDYHFSDATDYEYSQKSDEEEAESGVVMSGESVATESKGAVIKSMRNAKSMTRANMAAKMNMTVDRLGEIESGEEPDEEELKDIAVALGASLKDLQRRFARDEKAEAEKQEENSSADDEIEIIDDEEMSVEEDFEIMLEDDQSDQSETKEEIEIAEGAPVTPVTLFEEVCDYLVESESRTVKSHRLSGGILIEEKRSDGTLRFTVPMIEIGAVTANGNRYFMECAEGVVADINKLYESKKPIIQRMRASGDGELQEESRREPKHINLEIRGAQTLYESFTMMPTHAPRIDPAYGNALTSIAGVIVGGFINYETNVMYIVGETLPNTAGKDMAVLLDRDLVKGVSLVGVPTKYEENGKGPRKEGLDVKRLHFLGADFTNNPAMPFKNTADAESMFELANK